MKLKKKHRGLLILSGLTVFFASFVLLEDDLSAYMDINKDQSYIQVSVGTEFQGNIVRLIKSRGSIYFELKDGSKYTTIDNINTQYANERLTLFRIVDVGDTLWKRTASDSIHIFKYGEVLTYPIPSN